jgi:hypothetical protein
MVDPCSAKLLVTMVGAGFELIGLVLVVWQTWEDRDAARDIAARRPNALPQRRVEWRVGSPVDAHRRA